MDLVDGKTIDSFKIRAQNSLKNNFNQKNIEHHIEYIDNKIEEYESQLNQNDLEEDNGELQAKIKQQEHRKEEYQKVQAMLEESGEVNDTHALSAMAIKTKEQIGVKDMDVLADKGYHTGEELKRCEKENISTYVSPKAPVTRDAGLYPVTMFKYNKEKNAYTCPEGKLLKTNNILYKHSGEGNNVPFSFRRYTTTECKGCSRREKCTNGKRNGRSIGRSEYAQVIELNNQRVIVNPNYCRQRQQIAEHPFGTLKRQRGFTYTLTKGKENVLVEVGLTFICYNLTRCTTILGVGKVIKALKELCCHCFRSKTVRLLSYLKK